MGTWTELYSTWGNWNVSGNPGEVNLAGTLTAGASPTVFGQVSQASYGSGVEQAGRFWLTRLAVTLSDTNQPQVDAQPASGELFGTPNASGWYTASSLPVTVTVSDRGMGVRRLLLRDSAGGVHAYPLPGLPASCATKDPNATLMGGDTYTTSVPCPTSSAQYVVPVDMTTLGDGQYTVELGVQDAAGQTTYAASYAVKVNAPGANPGPGSPSGLADPGTPCPNGSYDDSGTCIKRAPSNSTAPALSGTARSSQTLSTSNGTWADIDNATWAYQWQLCSAAGSACVDIPGANDPTLALNDAMVSYTVRAIVTATTDGGTTSAPTNASEQITLANGTLGGGTGGAGGVRPAAVRAAGGSGGGITGGGGAVTERADSLPVPDPDVRYVGILNGQNAAPNSKMTVQTIGSAKYGAAVALTGRLVNPSGAPISGARLEVIVHPDIKGAAGRIVGAVRTNTDGKFRYVLPAGSSRIVTFAYRTSLSDDHYDQVMSTRVGVAEPVSLKASRASVRNGQTIRFTGKAAGVPAGSQHSAALQVRVGRSWHTIADTTMRNGAFTYKYRFTRTARPQTYTFRVLVSRTADWPYLDSASHSTKVKVKPATHKKRSTTTPAKFEGAA
jgi:hypothetical protein